MTSYIGIFAIITICCLTATIIAKNEKELFSVISAFLYVITMIYAITEIGKILDITKKYFSFESIPELQIILKIIGITILTTVSSHICESSGQSGISKILEVISTVEILKLTFPLLSKFLNAALNIFGE